MREMFSDMPFMYGMVAVVVGVAVSFVSVVVVGRQSCCEVSASLTDVGGLAVGTIDLINRSLSVPRFVFVFNVGGVGIYTEEVQVSTTETGIGEAEDVSGHSGASSPQMLPRQAVAETPTSTKLDAKLFH
ncbi:hypothetical protein AWC38_SpisGene19238 [Stylophora pistillata]|uniref:Transmembrane protein n=1 Tax=Stylophora pistillata TaxID=50429 RepID=A0A2B4RH44_STYPI|nr:hypothetical protein AWC38_SpisGene19238 [Stylophora pistillata]